MLQKYMHSKSKCELFMSATIGDFYEFAKTTGLDAEKSTGVVLPSTFDFSHSPIYYSNANRMSFSEKDKSLKTILKQIIDICKKNESCRGII